MSTALAIAGVTAVLRDLLNDGLINNNASGTVGSAVSISLLPPDRVLAGGNGDEQSQLNLFLYQVTPNAGWANERLPAVDATGRTRLTNQVLALDLHFLLSAYGTTDLHREILLGYAMQILHENPVLARQAIRTALDPAPDVGDDLPPALRALADCGLAEQVEQLRITHERLGTEEISKLWAATQSSYRPTVAYQVTVALIESSRPARSPLPVLTRSVVATPSLVPPVPLLEDVRPADGQPVVLLGTTVTLEGHDLDGTDHEVLLSCARFDVQATVDPDLVTAARVEFSIPEALADDFPVGVYQVSVRLVRPGGTAAVETNRLAFMLAPRVTNLPLVVPFTGAGTADVSLEFVPGVREGQSVSLFLRNVEVLPDPFMAPATSLEFAVRGVAAETYLARLRIDGIDSPIIDRGATPPRFLDRGITFQ